MVIETTELNKEFADRVEMVIEWILQSYGIEVEICSGVRTMTEQAQLYALGRTRRGRKVTNAKPGDSYHNYGLAVDLCLKEPVKEKGRLTKYPDKHPIWGYIGEAARVFGLSWGGEWKKLKDRPHIEVPIALDEIKKIYNQQGMEGVFTRASGVLKQEESV